jgi:hypothetical protein
MIRFWGAAGLLLVLGIAAILLGTGQSNAVMVYDLETECRYDRGEETYISLNEDNSLTFKGHYPLNNINTDLDYSYSGGGNIVLNLRSQQSSVPVNFWDDCLASGVYHIQTPQLEPGTYPVEIKSDGERLEKRIIRVKE